MEADEIIKAIEKLMNGKLKVHYFDTSIQAQKIRDLKFGRWEVYDINIGGLADNQMRCLN